MKVLQVVTDTDRRGAQVFAVDLHAALQRLGLQVRTFALAPTLHGELDLPTLGPARLCASGLTRLRRLMATADVVVAHGSTTLPATAIAARRLPTPVVYRSLGDPLYWATTPRRRLELRVLLRAMTAVVALWPAAAEGVVADLGMPAGRVRLIPNGVDSGRFAPPTPQRRGLARQRLGLDPERAVVATVGSLSREKGVDVLLDAAARIRPAPQVVLAGDGPERAALEGQARRLGLDIRFLGCVSEVRQVYEAADCVAVPSRTEGLPAAAIEAGLCAVPVAATDVGGVAEIVGRGPGLVAPEDPVALATAIENMLQAGVGVGESLRARCEERFTIEAVADRWMRLLCEVAHGRPDLGDSQTRSGVLC